jgi:hypothetical protein
MNYNFTVDIYPRFKQSMINDILMFSRILNADVYVLSDIEVSEQDIIEIISRLNAEEAAGHPL